MLEAEDAVIAGNEPSAQVIVFDREGLPVFEHRELELIIEPESFLAAGGDTPMGQQVVSWLAGQAGVQTIGIRFPKFTDGRGFSLAARLREAGYRGELHALGAISQDLVFQLRRVGFTHFHLENPGVTRIARNVLEPFGAYYQSAPDGSQAYWMSSDIQQS